MIGQKVRELREENDYLLRQLAAKLDIDTAQLSKMERGERLFKKEEITQIAKILNADEKELLSIWLADKICKIAEGEDYIDEALEIVSKKISEKK